MKTIELEDNEIDLVIAGLELQRKEFKSFMIGLDEYNRSMNLIDNLKTKLKELNQWNYLINTNGLTVQFYVIRGLIHIIRLMIQNSTKLIDTSF